MNRELGVFLLVYGFDFNPNLGSCYDDPKFGRSHNTSANSNTETLLPDRCCIFKIK